MNFLEQPYLSFGRQDDIIYCLLRVNHPKFTLPNIDKALDFVWARNSALRIERKPNDFKSKQHSRVKHSACEIEFDCITQLSDIFRELILTKQKGCSAHIIPGMAINRANRLETYFFILSAHSLHDGKSHGLIAIQMMYHMLGHHELMMEAQSHFHVNDHLELFDNDKKPNVITLAAIATVVCLVNNIRPLKRLLKRTSAPEIPEPLFIPNKEKTDIMSYPRMHTKEWTWDKFSQLRKSCNENNVSTSMFFGAAMLMVAHELRGTPHSDLGTACVVDLRKFYRQIHKEIYGVHLSIGHATVSISADDTVWTVAGKLKQSIEAHIDNTTTFGFPPIVAQEDLDEFLLTYLGPNVFSNPGYHLFPDALVEEAGITGYWAWSPHTRLISSGLWNAGIKNKSFNIILMLSTETYTNEFQDIIWERVRTAIEAHM